MKIRFGGGKRKVEFVGVFADWGGGYRVKSILAACAHGLATPAPQKVLATVGDGWADVFGHRWLAGVKGKQHGEPQRFSLYTKTCHVSLHLPRTFMLAYTCCMLMYLYSCTYKCGQGGGGGGAPSTFYIFTFFMNTLVGTPPLFFLFIHSFSTLSEIITNNNLIYI